MDSVGPTTRSRARQVAGLTPATDVRPSTARRSRRARNVQDEDQQPVAARLFANHEAPADEPDAGMPGAKDASEPRDQDMPVQQLEDVPDINAAYPAEPVDASWQTEAETDFSISGSLTPWPRTSAAPARSNLTTPAAAAPAMSPEPMPMATPCNPMASPAPERVPAQQSNAMLSIDTHGPGLAADADLIDTTRSFSFPPLPQEPSANAAAAAPSADFSFDVAVPEPVLGLEEPNTSTPTLLTPPKELMDAQPASGAASPASAARQQDQEQEEATEAYHATYVVTAASLSHTPAFTRTTAADYIDAATPAAAMAVSPAAPWPARAAGDDHHVGHVYEDEELYMDEHDSEGTLSDGSLTEDDAAMSEQGALTPMPARQPPASPMVLSSPMDCAQLATPTGTATPVAEPLTEEEVAAAFASFEEVDDLCDVYTPMLDGPTATPPTAAAPTLTPGAVSAVSLPRSPVTARQPAMLPPAASTATAAKAETPVSSPAPAARAARTPITAPAGGRAARPTPVAAPATAKAAVKGKAAGEDASARMLDALSDISSKAANRDVPAYMKPTQASLTKQQSPSKPSVSPAKPKLKSAVVADGYDGRSLRQLRKDIKAAAENRVQKEAALVQVCTPDQMRKKPANEQDWEVEESVDTVMLPEESDTEEVQGQLHEVDENILTSQMERLGMAPEPLRGVPVAKGQHVRFGENLTPVRSPGHSKTVLRGLPLAKGQHIHFD